MIIAADEAIPYVREAFSTLAEIRLFTGRNLRPEGIRDANALIVRTVTSVDASLLEGSSVRFVASASAGTDHIDRHYLARRGIRFCYAPGCNADAVAEYIVTALHVVAHRRKWSLRDKSLAIVGVGNVGSRVEKRARALGMEVLLCDPPLAEATGNTIYKSFEDVLCADILTFHVPLVAEGRHATWHMIDRKTLDHLAPNQYLINSARGAAFDNQELKTALMKNRVAGAILDAWEQEPLIDYSLLDKVDIGTPHIAGIALDGKIRATVMVHKELCDFYGLKSSWNADSAYPEPRLICPDKTTEDQNAILSVLLQAYNIMSDDADLRMLRSIPAEQAGARFEELRSQYPLRPEFRHFLVELNERHKHLASTFSVLGFMVRNAD